MCLFTSSVCYSEREADVPKELVVVVMAGGQPCNNNDNQLK